MRLRKIKKRYNAKQAALTAVLSMWIFRDLKQRVIVNYCKENGIEIDREYLTKQAAVGRKTYTPLSRCVFLKDNLCSIYPVRPIACRKHWVKTDPSLCDFSNNIINQVGGYFDINTEILASAVLNAEKQAHSKK